MSKAFTRESDDSAEDEISSVRTQLPLGARNYITREGVDRLKQRLNGLLQEKQQLAQKSNEAGIPPETKQRKIETAIRNLQQILDSVVVAEIPADRERIAFGANVVIRHGNGEERAYRIVGVEESDPDRDLISWISPLARALFSRKAGDRVLFSSPAGEEELTILAVSYQAIDKT